MKTLIMIFTVVAVGLTPPPAVGEKPAPTVASAVKPAPAVAQGGGAVWNEVGDAGDRPGTAQETACQAGQALTTINGSLANGADVDMYCIHIDGLNYSASLCGGAAFDTQLWLFEPDGTGFSFRDDSDCGLQSTLGELQPGPGDFLLAVSGYDKDALNSLGLEIWADTPFGTERPPDGPGMLMPVVTSWGTNTGAFDAYSIVLTGVSCCDTVVPVQPTTWGSIKATYGN